MVDILPVVLNMFNYKFSYHDIDSFYHSFVVVVLSFVWGFQIKHFWHYKFTKVLGLKGLSVWSSPCVYIGFLWHILDTAIEINPLISSERK